MPVKFRYRRRPRPRARASPRSLSLPHSLVGTRIGEPESVLVRDDDAIPVFQPPAVRGAAKGQRGAAV